MSLLDLVVIRKKTGLSPLRGYCPEPIPSIGVIPEIPESRERNIAELLESLLQSNMSGLIFFAVIRTLLLRALCGGWHSTPRS